MGEMYWEVDGVHATEESAYKSVRHNSIWSIIALCTPPHHHGDSAGLHTKRIAHANSPAELTPWTMEMFWIACCGERAGTTTTTCGRKDSMEVSIDVLEMGFVRVICVLCMYACVGQDIE
jgi:hypothetical protein